MNSEQPAPSCRSIIGCRCRSPSKLSPRPPSSGSARWPEVVVQLTLADNCVLTEQRLLRHQLGRIRDVRVDVAGVLYVLTDGGEGALYRVELPHNETRGVGRSRL